MIFRYPDKPVSAPPSILPTLQDGAWLCQPKHDGWRAVVMYDGPDGRLNIATRMNEPKIMHLATPAFLDAVKSAIARFEPPVILDGEYMGMRDGQPEHLWLFDVLMVAGADLTKVDAARRYGVLGQHVAPNDLVSITPVASSDYLREFEATRGKPGLEGVVLKRGNSAYIGSIRASVENPGWLKVRWKGGEGGNQVIA